MLNSGSLLSYWAIQDSSVDLLGQAKQLSAMYGCGNRSVPDMVECMKQVPATDFLSEELFVSVNADSNNIFTLIFVYPALIGMAMLISSLLCL